MREKPRDKGRLEHILQAISNIEEFLNNKTSEDFQQDKMLYFAVVKNLEIIGEASYMLTQDYKDRHPDTDWNSMTTMRHILVHGYYHIDSGIVWNTIKNDIPALKEQMISYLAQGD